MKYAALLLPLVLLAACGPGDSNMRRVCPAESLQGYVGRPVVDVAANVRMKPMRLVDPGEAAPVERRSRLTIRHDGQGNIAELFCG